MIKRLIFSIFIVVIIAILAGVVISYSRGYRFNLKKKSLSSTGILSASSYPDKASIWINGKLTSVTSASISLPPDWYDVEISKENYQSWKKRVRVQGELVSQIDALLIPTNPSSLKALTVNGVLNPILSPSKTKIAFIIPENTATNSANIKSKKGLWLLELKDGNPLGGNIESRPLYVPSNSFDWENVKIYWSEDEKTIILTFFKKEEVPQEEKETVQTAILVSTDANSVATNITPSYKTFLDLWEKEIVAKREENITSLLHPSMANILSTSADLVNFSPDETKVYYLATASATLAQVITPPIIGSNSTEEVRKLEKDNFYIYDIKEDKNYFITSKDSLANVDAFQWYSDSKHIVMIENDTIYIVDYDGTNKRTVYSGPFENDVVYPWASGNRLVILVRLNKPNTLPNFYQVDLR